MLQARASLRAEEAKLHRMLLRIVRADAVCRRFMTAPGIGAVVAVFYRTADDPMDLGPYFGLTPYKYQSGEVDRTGRITKVGDVMVRTALFEAAPVILTRVTRFSTLQALRIAKQRGFKRAKVALAGKLAVVLHRMWVDGTDFRWRKAAACTHRRIRQGGITESRVLR
jgi:transposase